MKRFPNSRTIIHDSDFAFVVTEAIEIVDGWVEYVKPDVMDVGSGFNARLPYTLDNPIEKIAHIIVYDLRFKMNQGERSYTCDRVRNFTNSQQLFRVFPNEQ